MDHIRSIRSLRMHHHRVDYAIWTNLSFVSLMAIGPSSKHYTLSPKHVKIDSYKVRPFLRCWMHFTLCIVQCTQSRYDDEGILEVERVPHSGSDLPQLMMWKVTHAGCGSTYTYMWLQGIVAKVPFRILTCICVNGRGLVACDGHLNFFLSIWNTSEFDIFKQYFSQHISKLVWVASGKK